MAIKIKKKRESKWGTRQVKGISLRPSDALDPDSSPISDSSDDLVFTEGMVLEGHGPIPPEIRKAIVIDRAKGVPSRITAAKYGVAVSSVRSIWKEFSTEVLENQSRISAEDDPTRFRSKIRKKAVDAIESGLDCDKDPYRRASVGIKVMEGIGEFRGEGMNVSFNTFVAGVPAEWRDKYLPNKIQEIKQENEGEVNYDDK